LKKKWKIYEFAIDNFHNYHKIYLLLCRESLTLYKQFMRIESFILATLAIITLTGFSQAGEANAVNVTVSKGRGESAVKAAPFENYWAAQSWDSDGAAFWHAKKETPAPTTPKETEAVTATKQRTGK